MLKNLFHTATLSSNSKLAISYHCRTVPFIIVHYDNTKENSITFVTFSRNTSELFIHQQPLPYRILLVKWYLGDCRHTILQQGDSMKKKTLRQLKA